MSMKLVRRMLTAVLATTLVVGSALTVSAAPTTKSSAPAAEAPAPVQEDSAPVDETVVPATTPMTIGGATIKSDVAGSIAIPKTAPIAGVVLRESAANIKAAASLAKNETPYVRAYEITAKKSPAAFASINAAATAAGATVVDAVNIDLGKLAGGKFSDLPAGVSVPTTIGVKNANGRTLAVVKVLPGGATEILQDTDDNPATVTFPITGGFAAYAVIAF
ncbi:MAG: hypothetical protein E7306_00760 [Butyrivibrio sp.]|nr:hypothetical protein [Butyrivibrio sp.]